MLRLTAVDMFGMPRREVGKGGIETAEFGRGVSDENMENFTTSIHLMSSQLSVMIRIEAEVIEGIDVEVVEIRARRWDTPEGSELRGVATCQTETRRKGERIAKGTAWVVLQVHMRGGSGIIVYSIHTFDRQTAGN
ncbi:MAG: hypothetical protein WA798_06155 [Candidatus Acidiferrum sp.]